MTDDTRNDLKLRAMAAIGRLGLPSSDLHKAAAIFGIFSPAFNGVLLGLARLSWECPALCVVSNDGRGDEETWSVRWSRLHGEGFASRDCDTEEEALVSALEAAP